MNISGRVADSERLRYLLVGGYNTAFGCVSFLVLYWALHTRLHYLTIIALAHLVNLLNAFVGYRLVVFRAKGPVLTNGLRFSLVYVVALVANLALLPPAVAVLGGRVVLAQGLVIVVTITATYLAHRHFSFRRSTDVPVVSR